VTRRMTIGFSKPILLHGVSHKTKKFLVQVFRNPSANLTFRPRTEFTQISDFLQRHNYFNYQAAITLRKLCVEDRTVLWGCCAMQTGRN
jgi:hypothetical protein